MPRINHNLIGIYKGARNEIMLVELKWHKPTFYVLARLPLRCSDFLIWLRFPYKRYSYRIAAILDPQRNRPERQPSQNLTQFSHIISLALLLTPTPPKVFDVYAVLRYRSDIYPVYSSLSMTMY